MKLAGADLFHLGYPTIMRRMFEHPEELLEIYRRVKELGVKTSLDLTLIEEDCDVAHTDWKKLFQKLLPSVDFFVPSAEEICFLIDKERYHEWIERASGRVFDRGARHRERYYAAGRQASSMGSRVRADKMRCQRIVPKDRGKFRNAGRMAGQRTV